MARAPLRNRLVILDRDGVINEERLDYIRSVDQWRPLPGSIEAIASLCRAGLAVAVATNQSGIGRGYLTSGELDAIHARMEAAVREAGGGLAGVFHCPHTPADRCRCRKPLPGLLERIEAAVGLPVAGEYMVGDSMRDLEAASAAGARPALVRTGFGAATEQRLSPGGAVPVFDDLAEFTGWLLRSVE
ncbi:MAG: D-glycero-beta-D-manno-heptose 1,7-bisphosphate 7-phosphatase [Gammaproteobacteria bacterium]|nr:D-glycero-beta-D-manno-heptose 1,7-bisphosphate 7-phosphatase [Gammaproteobacteria bacterium]